MHKCNMADFSNWLKIQTLIPPNIPNNDLLDFAQSHESTKTKITFADYHYHILNQFYRPNVTRRETDTDSWVRAEFHSLVINLYSSLDSLAYEINLAYNFGLKPYQINIYHTHTSFQQNCIRCNIDEQNDGLTALINIELAKSWFQIFNKLRNQIVHKNIPLITIKIGGSTTKITIPDDPSNTNPQSGDYSQDLEISQYSQTIRKNVANMMEQTYPLIESRIKNRYNL